MPRPNTVTLQADSDATEMVLPSAVGRNAEFDDTLPQGALLGDYVVDAVVGRGGGGVVYAARPLAGGTRVAIKVLRTEMAFYPSMITRFLREAESVQQIRHPNIIEIYQIGEIEPRRPYYVMELLEGTDLRKLLQVHGRFSAPEVLALMTPICQAVEAAHRAGIIHRDIKANNVVVVDRKSAADESTARVVKLLDFGIAKMLNAESNGQGLTEPGAMLGTAHNMAPEQIRCERLDTRVDIYALGVLIYQLLTGQFPFHADDPRQVALLHLQVPAPRPSALAPVSPAVDAVVLKCLEKRADNRFASAADLLAALASAIDGEEAGAEEQTRQAAGIFLALALAPTEDEELDEAAFEDMSCALDQAEQQLAELGYSFPLKTSTALLGIRILSPRLSVEAANVERAQTVRQVESLRRALAERSGAEPTVTVALSFRLGEVHCRVADETLSVVGGPLLDVGAYSDPGE